MRFVFSDFIVYCGILFLVRLNILFSLVSLRLGFIKHLFFNAVVILSSTVRCFIVATTTNHLFYGYVVLEVVGFLICVMLLNLGGGRNLEGLVKYFRVNSVASVFLLLAVFVIFRTNGSVSILDDSNRLPFCWVLFFVGSIRIKLGLFPFSLWNVDLVQSTTFLYNFLVLCVFKIPYFYRFLVWGLFLCNNISGAGVKLRFGVGFVSVLFGAFGALVQSTLKRFLAFSSLNQMGYILLLFSVQELDSFLLAIGFFMMYVGSTAVLVLNFAEYRKVLNNGNVVFLNDLRSFGASRSVFSFLMVVGSLLALRLFPLTFPFFFKLALLQFFIFEKQFFFVFVLLVVGVITIFYYLRIVKLLVVERMLIR